jgi:hypothetical protein
MSAAVYVDETTDFRLVPLVRQAFLTGKFEVFQEMKEKVHFWPTGPDFFTKIPEKEHMVYWTENHLAGILSTEYLIAQHYGETLPHERLLQFLTSRIRYGSSEYLSVAYQAYTMAAILNVVDFCKDERLRELATEVCTIIANQYARVVNPFTGAVASAGGRVYEYMRTATDGLKISPLCYVLIGQPERMERFNPMKFTLAYALQTTSYRVPQSILDVVIERRQPGTHSYEFELTKPSLSTDEPIWICWSYGQYANMSRAIETVRFFYEHGLHHHHHFSSASKLFGLGTGSVLILQLILLFLYPLFAIILRMFGTSSWLTNVTLHTVTLVRDQSVVVVTAAVPKNAHGRPAAQQYPCQILVNDKTVHIGFGKILSGVKKEMSGMSMLPHVHVSSDGRNAVLNVRFSSYNPFFVYRTRHDAVEVTGEEQAKTLYPEWTIDVSKKGTREVTFTVSPTPGYVQP